MLSAAAELDRALFHKINAVWTCGLLDAVLPALTNFHRFPWVRWGLLPALAAVFVWKGKKRAAQALLAAALLVGCSDLLAHRVLKPLARRPRPEAAGVSPVLRENLHVGWSFPSNHATNMFALAVFLSILYPAAAAPLLALAAAVAYSRVYVGVHFPLDVLAGALFGGALGWAAARGFKKVVDSRS